MKNASFAVWSRVAAAGVFVIAIGGLFGVAIASPGSGLLDLHFNAWALLSATTICLNLGLLVYFVAKPARSEERIWLSAFLISVVVYAVGELLERLSVTPSAALFWSNISDMGALAPVALYLFSLSYTNRSERRYPGITALLLVGSLILVFFYAFTNLIWVNTPAAMTLEPWGYAFGSAKSAGPGLYFSLFWFDGLCIVALLRLISFRRHTRNDVLRKQSLLFIFALIIPIVLGSITDGLLPSLGFNVPALAITLYTPAGFLIVYGVLRYQLLTISPTLFSNTILAIMQEAVVVTDEQFNILFVNERAEHLLGVSNEATSKVTLTSMVTADSLAAFEQAFKDNPSKTFDIDHIDISSKHGQSVPVRLLSSPFSVANAETRVIVLADITKELQTRSVIEHEVDVRTHQLNEARAYLVSSINSLEQGFMLINHHSSVELSNERASTYVKLTDTELAGAEIDKATKNLDWNIDLSKLIHHVLTKHKAQHHEVAAGDGSFYQVFVTPVLTGEHVLGATVIIEDVTEEKILNRSKDEFFSIASHELRTPLTAIRGNMGMVKDYYPEAMKDESLKSMINDTHDASVRLIEIVNDFLDSSKLEQGKLQFDMQPVSVEDVATAIQKDLESLAAKREDMIAIADLSKLPKVSADPTRLQQILYNLLSNAVKYSEKATITVSGSLEGNTVKIRVTDTGKGISPENQKLLFHKFQQASSSTLTREDTKGTGLGLYIARLLATNMHGNVELESSEVGKGSTFVVSMGAAE